MKRYWDLSTKEKAALSRDDLEPYIRIELMEQGVLVPPPPIDEPIEGPTIPTVHRFGIKLNDYTQLNIAFRSSDDAAQFAALPVELLDHDYIGGGGVDYVKPATVAIVPLDIPEESSVQQHREALKTANEAKARNKKARDEYDKAVRETEKAAAVLIGDWGEACSLERQYQRIRDTLAEYTRMADGSETIALGFLSKAFSADDIAEATGLTVAEPSVDTPCASASDNTEAF